MAEFCLECWNAINDFDDPPEANVMSWRAELCEGCGEWKRVVIRERRCILIQCLLGLLRKCRK